MSERLQRLGAELHSVRGEAAPRLASAVLERLRELAMSEARFEVALEDRSGGYGARELVLRVNPLDTPWGHADLAAAATMPIDAVLLPKVESADRVRLTVSLLDALGAPESLAVWCMVETPRSVLEVRDIAAASPRLAALVLGGRDRPVGLCCAFEPELGDAIAAGAYEDRCHQQDARCAHGKSGSGDRATEA